MKYKIKDMKVYRNEISAVDCFSFIDMIDLFLILQKSYRLDWPDNYD